MAYSTQHGNEKVYIFLRSSRIGDGNKSKGFLMKQLNVIAIGIIIVVAIVAITALAFSGSRPQSNSSTTAPAGGYSTSSVAPTVSTTAGNATKNSTVQANSTSNKYDFIVGHSTTVGNYLENSTGFALYLLTADSPYNSSACTAECATYWPPYTLAGSVSSLSAQTGINASAFGTITRSGGSKQLTYDGWPLYYYVGDSAAGQTNGEGINAFGGTWYAVTVPKATT